MPSSSQYLLLSMLILIDLLHGSRSIDCYACGFDYIHPEHDVPGSYGYKIYNHSCEELQKLGSFSSRFVRSCPIGVQNCFGSIGALKQGGSIYEKKIVLGCAESPYLHPYGCDTEEVFVQAKDRHNYTTQKVNVEVRMCFCSSYLCNTPQSMRLLSHSTSSGNCSTFINVFILFIAIIFHNFYFTYFLVL